MASQEAREARLTAHQQSNIAAAQAGELGELFYEAVEADGDFATAGERYHAAQAAYDVAAAAYNAARDAEFDAIEEEARTGVRCESCRKINCDCPWEEEGV